MKNKLTVLLIEDDRADMLLMQALVQEVSTLSIDLLWADRMKKVPDTEGWERADVVLLDLDLPDAFGRDAIRDCRELLPEKPIVILTGNSAISMAADAMHEGAQDYLVKGRLDAPLLEKTLVYAIERQHLLKRLDDKIAQARAGEEAVKHLLDNSLDGIVVVDSRGKVQLANPAACRLLGKSGQELAEAFDYKIVAGATAEIEVRGYGERSRFAEMRTVAIRWKDRPAQLVLLRDTTEQKQMQAELNRQREVEQFLAYHDTLTNLPNRHLLLDRLEQTLARAKRYGHEFAVLFADLDDFKKINDQHGHLAGDAVLKAIAGRLQRAIRESDTVARFGGDEFLIVLERLTSKQDAATIGLKLAEALSEPISWEGQKLSVTASVGLSCFPDDATSIDELVARADSAMYAARKLGKNRCCAFAEAYSASNGGELAFEDALNAAMEQGHLVPFFQPQIDLDSGRVTGFEALVRWQHPEKGTISPAQFIPLAEKHGLINRIDEFMLLTTCRQAKEWQSQGLGALRVSVNLNANLFRQERLPDLIADILGETGLSPRQLCLEITETQVMQEVESTIEILNNLKAMHVQLSIDDFGTGYSSLSYLKRFPIDMLKIDRAFLDGIPGDHHNVAITTAIIALARSMELRVVGEGVEEPEQLEFLKSLDCDEIQGFLVGRPGDVDAMSRLLASDYCLYSFS